MTATDHDGNSVLMGAGGAPAAKFTGIGARVEGKLLNDPVAFEEREYNTQTKRSDGAVKRFPSGDPIMGVHIDLQTTQRDPSINDDDGIRRLYIQGKRMKAAAREAVVAAGADGMRKDGYIVMVQTGEEDTGQGSPAKLYAAHYTPPAQQAFMGGVAPSQPVAPVVPQPAPVVQDPWTAQQPGQPQWNPAPAAPTPTQQPAAQPAPVAAPVAATVPVASAPTPTAPASSEPAPSPQVDPAMLQAALANLTSEQKAALGIPAG